MSAAILSLVCLSFSAIQLPEIEPVPQPNFQKPVDYVAWYRQQLSYAGRDNALQDYAAFLYKSEGMEPANPLAPRRDSPVDKAIAKVMQAAKPWRTAEEKLLQQWVTKFSGLYLQPFLKGANHRYFAIRVEPSAKLLSTMRLPTLANGRTLGKLAFVRSWHVTNNTFDPGLYVEATKSNLAYVRAVGQGLTMDEQFIAGGQRMMTYDEVTRSLANAVLLPEKWKEILTVVAAYDDLSVTDLQRRSFYFSEAAAQQLLQHFCTGSSEPASRQAEGKSGASVNMDLVTAYVESLSEQARPKDDQLAALEKVNPAELATLIHEYFSGLRDIAAQPFVSNLQQQVHDLEVKTLDAHPALHVFAEPYGLTLETAFRQEATRRMFRLFLNLAIALKDTGKWPEELQAIAGPTTEGCMIDPFSGKPFKLVKAGERVAVYSVGPDGEDNGGKQGEDIIFSGPVIH